MGKQQVRPTFLPERTVNPVPRRLGDVRKAEQLLGFCSEVSLEEGLDHLVAWRREVLRRGEEAAYEASHTPKAIGLLANSPNPS
jgi:UDP-glucose 4-epimerase